MRLPEAKIQDGILHPESEVRLRAVEYFAQSHSEDPSIMPRVITAIDQHGWEGAHQLLRTAAGLRQTPATIDWLITQLGREFDRQDQEDGSLRDAMTQVLVAADPGILAERQYQIDSLAGFPGPVKAQLAAALRLHVCEWPRLWAEFEALGRQIMRRNDVTVAENRRMDQIITALARHRDAGSQRVLALLRRRYGSFDQSLMLWLEPRIIELAGKMRLQAAIPLLIERLDDLDEAVAESIPGALAWIGTDAVIEAVAETWKRADDGLRKSLIAPLACIHGDLAVTMLLSLFAQTQETALRSALAHAALGQFAGEGIELARRVLLEAVEETQDYRELRHRLVATATIMGATFPEYRQWHEEAVIRR